MLADDVYDAFVLVPLYMAMYFKHDLHIHGNMSKRLYKNVMNYLQRILCDFSPDLSRVNVTADGFAEAGGEQNIIGAGISCGVDSLTTIYDRYVNEADPDYRVNGLFLFNCGSHGDYGEGSSKLWQARYELNKKCADELGLPVYQADSNFHAFTHMIQGGGTKAGYFATWSCILGFQGAVKKYYVSSAYSYSQILTFGLRRSNNDFSEFSESYSVPLIRTERLELISDGCQYERSQKTEHIAGWDIAQRYLNVCVTPDSEGHNCSKCHKCLTTLTALEAVGKLNNFAGIFSIETYRKHVFKHLCERVIGLSSLFMVDNDPSLSKFLVSHGMKLPSYLTAWLYLFPSRAKGLVKSLMKKAAPKLYARLKRALKPSHSS